MDDWPEIAQSLEERRRELTIKGSPDIHTRVNDLSGKLPNVLFALELLNFLEISSCDIEELSEKISSLSSLANLILSSNKIQSLPQSFCTLAHLKVLDLSYNQIDVLPDRFGELTSLQSLNINNNKLSEFPQSFSSLSRLSSLNISNNAFKVVPKVLFEIQPNHITELTASHNVIEYVDDGFENLEALKILDLSENKILELPQSIASCSKLKQANYKGNPLKDGRLKKLIEQSNSKQKAIMDYIRTKGRPPRKEEGDASKTGGKKKKGKKAKPEVEEELIKYIVKVLKMDDFKEALDADVNSTLKIVVTDEVKDVRPYIVCCILRRLDLTREESFKKFIALQTKIHDEVCGRRTLATIATHDLESLKNTTIIYDAKEPDTFNIQPLGHHEQVSGIELYKKLKQEAETMKKDNKRNQVSGIHKYLSLLERHEKFAYLKRESDDAVISLPPLTNSEISKISSKTKDILVEVTGSEKLSICKMVMDKLISGMLDRGIYSQREQDFYSDSSDEEVIKDTNEKPFLLVQQVQILDSHGKLKVLYPSRTDLDIGDPKLSIVRPH